MSQKPLIEMSDIVKSFGGVNALSGITFDVLPGEIHGLVGENGAGKSTLMKILSGAYKPDSGSITVDGIEHNTLNPKLSRHFGIEIIYQENLLVNTMNIVENIFIGNEIANKGFMDYRKMTKKTMELLETLELELDPQMRVERLSVAEQQYVKILKALITNPRLLIMDEPTSMFNVRDAQKVLDLVKRIAERGISIIYISHFLTEVVQVSDRITVIRDGAEVSSYDNSEHNTDLDLITMDMVGRSVELFYQREHCELGDVAFEVNELQLTRNSPKVSFSVRKGEILGLAGMVGSGRTEIISGIVGSIRRHSGEIILNGNNLTNRNPRESIRAGIAYITEDRQKLGLMLNISIQENMLIVALDKLLKNVFINPNRLFRLIKDVYEQLSIKARSHLMPVKHLSGGNQQKVVLGKWLVNDAEVFIFDEPTRGIDVNAKSDFYKIMSKLAGLGKSIIMISSDMPELISMSDRVLVVKKDEIIRELNQDEISEQNVIKYALNV